MGPLALLQQDIDNIRSLADNACSDPIDGLPCASISLVGDGRHYKDQLLEYSISPRKDESSQTERSGSDVYWLASCTKLVTSIACMQLAEKQILHLDDADIVEQLCPELRDVKVLQDDGSLVEKKRRITLRMLLTHTCEPSCPLCSTLGQN